MDSYYQQVQDAFRGILNATVPYFNDFLNFCLQPTGYEYNPHEYVKIWLSANPDVFMPQIHQLRLIRTRQTNPKDIIHLVYDGKLLSPEALNKLKTFCETYNIIFHDVREDIIPACKTKEENRLITLYEDEVLHLEESGNLAVATDLLRVLSPVYAWTYTDFDVDVDTSTLPETINVKEPLLISFDASTGTFCTDAFAVVHPEDASEILQMLQRIIIDACSPEPAQEQASDFSPDILENPKAFCQKMLDDCLALGYSVREYRNFISNMDSLTCGSIALDEINSFEALLASLNSAPASANKMKMEMMIQEAVMNTTGPNVYARVIEQYIQNNWIKMLLFNRLCGTLSKYHLQECFKGQVFSTSHNNDRSWLPSGIQKLREEEVKMDEAASKIGRLYRGYKAKSKDALDRQIDTGGVEETKGEEPPNKKGP
ncbi:MAG: glycosyltransferase family 88 protein [Legionellaceae bacterium]|nr:glycosyltransferase family 88 protein [Legionellaceae bacterium]